MTTLRFVGECPLWLGILLSLIVAAMAWRLYLRERDELPGRFRWLLPLLRSLTFCLGVLILTGPVLHHRKTTGELGQVQIYLDDSASMAILDQHMTLGRQYALAEELGFLRPGSVDFKLTELANELAAIRSLSPVNMSDGKEATEDHFTWQKECQRVATSIEKRLSPELLAIPEVDEAMVPFRSESNHRTEANSESESSEQDNVLAESRRLSEATVKLEATLRSQFDVEMKTFHEAASDDILAATARVQNMSRYERVNALLSGDDKPVLQELAKRHDVEVFRLRGDESVAVWRNGEWIDGRSTRSSDQDSTRTEDLIVTEPTGTATNLNDGIVSRQRSDLRSFDSETDEETGAGETVKSTQIASGSAGTAIVLISDGQHNAGSSPLQTARVLGQQGTTYYPVAVGARNRAEDLAIVKVEAPEMVFQKDRVRGSITIRDEVKPGTPFIVKIEHTGTMVWEETAIAQNNGTRRIEFEFPVEELVEKTELNFDDKVARHAVPLKFTATISSVEGESEIGNNSKPLRIAAIVEHYKALILDGRSRWETRYLRNVFERDPQWDVSTVIAHGEVEPLQRGKEPDQFPSDRNTLYEYDLILLGEIASSQFREEELQWLNDFVTKRGGGMVFIDGHRGHLRSYSEHDLGSLIPIEWVGEPIHEKPIGWELSDRGANEAALRVLSGADENRQFWRELPAPHSVINVRALTGSQVLASVRLKGEPTPVMVTRVVGAGRVLYLATDETWRWRYKAADTYHQRIWHQLAKLAMPRPFAVSDEYLAIDTGPLSYEPGERADVRIRLTNPDGTPAENVTVDAVVLNGTDHVATIRLEADPEIPGIYRGRTDELAPGEHAVSIQASGFNSEALALTGRFVVTEPENREQLETGTNEELLRQIADASHGTFLLEEEVSQLPELLAPLSHGEVIESETPLWQSFWWFGAIVLLLSLEWMLRKRAGML